MSKTTYYCVIKEGETKLYYKDAKKLTDGDEPFAFDVHCETLQD